MFLVFVVQKIDPLQMVFQTYVHRKALQQRVCLCGLYERDKYSDSVLAYPRPCHKGTCTELLWVSPRLNLTTFPKFFLHNFPISLRISPLSQSPMNSSVYTNNSLKQYDVISVTWGWITLFESKSIHRLQDIISLMWEVLIGNLLWRIGGQVFPFFYRAH